MCNLNISLALLSLSALASVFAILYGRRDLGNTTALVLSASVYSSGIVLKSPGIVMFKSSGIFLWGLRSMCIISTLLDSYIPHASASDSEQPSVATAIANVIIGIGLSLGTTLLTHTSLATLHTSDVSAKVDIITTIAILTPYSPYFKTLVLAVLCLSSVALQCYTSNFTVM